MTDNKREQRGEQEEGPFTPLLRGLWRECDALEAALFVDPEGESIDYCSAGPVYETKVLGAHLSILLRLAQELPHGGTPAQVSIWAADRQLLVRGVGEGYALVLAFRTPQELDTLESLLQRVAHDLRGEAGIDPPVWELLAALVSVRTRSAVGWPFAPHEVLCDGQWHEVDAVLGRWQEGSAGELACFRVRQDSGAEYTLVHEERSDRWLRRTHTA